MCIRDSAWPASSKKTTAISSAEEPSSEEGDTAQSAETESADKKAGRAAGTKLAYKEVSRAPGTDSVDEKIRTAADVETRADVEAAAKEDAVNLEILEQMTALNEKGEFSEAIKATEGMNKNGDSAPKIIALRNEIIRGKMCIRDRGCKANYIFFTEFIILPAHDSFIRILTERNFYMVIL